MLETYGKMVSGGTGMGQPDGRRHLPCALETAALLDVLWVKEILRDVAGNCGAGGG